MSGKLISPKLFRVYFGLILGLSFTFVFYADRVESQEKVDQTEILVIGNGRIIKENIAAARKYAISDALTKGVEEYLTKTLGIRGMINNFQRIIHDVIPGSGEEIENFHILAEERHEKNYKVLASIKVNESLMEEKLRDMGIILLEGPPIKLLFLVSQKMPQDKEISYWWGDPESEALTSTELVLHRVFQERGFDPVNRLLSVPEEKVTPEMRKLELSDRDAVEWGRLLSADYVIYGENEVIEKKTVSMILKVFHVEKGEFLTQDSEIKIIPENTLEPDRLMDVLERSVRDIAVRLSPLMIESFKEGEDIENTVEVELRGLKSFEQFRRFRDFLKDNISGITSITQTRIKGDSMTLLVEFTGKKEMFFKKIKEHQKFPFQADIYPIEDGGIIIDIESSPPINEEIHTD